MKSDARMTDACLELQKNKKKKKDKKKKKGGKSGELWWWWWCGGDCDGDGGRVVVMVMAMAISRVMSARFSVRFCSIVLANHPLLNKFVFSS